MAITASEARRDLFGLIERVNRGCGSSRLICSSGAIAEGRRVDRVRFYREN